MKKLRHCQSTCTYTSATVWRVMTTLVRRRKTWWVDFREIWATGRIVDRRRVD